MLLILVLGLTAADEVLVPKVDGEWWRVAGDPDLGKYTTPKQQPVDFGICRQPMASGRSGPAFGARRTRGKTRLFYRWQGAKLTDKDWEPMGIAMQADPSFGETEGGLQAPHVIKLRNEYLMFYGDWEHIDLAKGMDGKSFARQLLPDGKSGMFTEELGANTRDPMVLRIGDRFHLYYTAYPKKLGAVYLRMSKDLKQWSASKVVAFGGEAGTGPFSAECPFVYYHAPSGYYYLFRTQHYGEKGTSRVYRSKNPADFGVNDDKYLVATVPYAAPEIVEHEGQLYVAALLPTSQHCRQTVPYFFRYLGPSSIAISRPNEVRPNARAPDPIRCR